MSTVDDLRAEVRALAQLRHTFDKIDGKLKAEKARQFEEIKQLLHLHEAAKQARDVTEQSVREIQETNPTWLVDGLEVVTGKELQHYSEPSAVNWLIHHGHHDLLKLGDRKTYEKLAVLLGTLMQVPTVKVRIASDLSAYLPKETEDE